MTIPHTFIQELIARADVVEIVGRYVQLKKGGANFMGLCPFHSEKSPSFSVSPTKQFYHCFGCGKSGDALRFLMDHAGMTFIEAVNDLAQQFGMQVPEDDASPQDRARAAEQKQKQATLTDVLEQACTAYKKHLRDSPRAIDYFKGRGLSGEIAKQFDLGYAPEGWRSLAGVFPRYDDPLLAESGLVITSEDDPEKRYDRFRDRVMFPIRNVKGECIGFGGRVLGDDKPKYLNSPETPVFSKGRELYGLFEARNALRDAGYALVTEGYMDVVALAQLGFPNAVATLGTACTADHLQKLFRFTDAVVFSFDGDAAGRRAARKALDGALPLATDVRSCKFLFLPAEHDPDSYIRAYGRDAFARYISEATPLSRFLIESVREGCDLNSAEGRAHLASNAKPLWSQLPEGALKRQLLGEIADLVQLNSNELTDVWAGKAIGQRSEAKSSKKYSTPYTPGKRYSPKEPPIGSDSAGRRQPASRADHATRLLLANSSGWDSLTHEDHALLCELPAPHGPLFVWLESQQHEHGPQDWEALRGRLQAQAFESLALKLMSSPVAAGAPDAADAPPAREALQELRALLNLMLIDRLKQLETEALEAAKSDPTALQRYRELNARRRELMAATAGTSTS
ncbi:DNA primase [Rhodoferax sp. OV413]|uniref:DNA primase n=1 Tax=Rhodoferax sp. OV413 TaxID=1855285 RepID=UPI00088FBC66|nr:DNA primase [Rhodoferax sp. OV413]SDO02784.1 DNA primase [Rhodoferax sp. OV413]